MGSNPIADRIFPPAHRRLPYRRWCPPKTFCHKDSNLERGNQNPLCYHYTTGYTPPVRAADLRRCGGPYLLDAERSGSLTISGRAYSGRGSRSVRRSGLGVGRREAALWRGVEGLGGLTCETQWIVDRTGLAAVTTATGILQVSARLYVVCGPGRPHRRHKRTAEGKSRTVLDAYPLLCAYLMVC